MIRKPLLLSLSLLALLLAPGAALADPAATSLVAPAKPASPAGSWRLVITPEDANVPPFRAFATLDATGGVVASAQGDSLLAISSMSTAGHGSWRFAQRGNPRTVLFTIHYVWYGAQGEYEGGAVIRNEVVIAQDGDTLAGLVTFDWLDADDQVFYSGTSTIVGTRIHAEPLVP